MSTKLAAAHPPGLRGNGGQYTQAATWAILAKAKLKDGDGPQALFALLNPINHALTPETASRYKVEPYVLAADIYATAPHVGRGGAGRGTQDRLHGCSVRVSKEFWV